MIHLPQGAQKSRTTNLVKQPGKPWSFLVGALLLSSSLLAATPTEQNAIVQAGTAVNPADAMSLQRVPVLEPGEDEVLVRVYAASVNPVEWKRSTGMFDNRPASGGYAEPHYSAPTPENTLIPGSDAAGVIEKLGPGVTDFKVGDPVVAAISSRTQAGGMNGSYSEYAIAAVDSIFIKPDNMTFAEASGLGTATRTGAGAVISMGVKAGDRVLVLGAAGGVGSAAVQMAKARGAYVIGTASGRHADYLQSIGIDEHHDYRTETWQDEIKNIDYVIDTVSHDNLVLAMSTVKPGASVVGYNGNLTDDECKQYQVNCLGRGMGSGNVTEEVAKLAYNGKLIVNVDATFPLAEAGAAQEENRNGGTQGKIVLAVDPDKANSK